MKRTAQRMIAPTAEPTAMPAIAPVLKVDCPPLPVLLLLLELLELLPLLPPLLVTVLLVVGELLLTLLVDEPLSAVVTVDPTL
jgi:hypothetical protein